ncbi:MAG TPA: hypothetical protein VM509_10635 [Planctomycetota bacterium]|nr:hypothetical protein [Planctomycetota bacterium]
MLIALGVVTALPFLVCIALFLWKVGGSHLRFARAVGACALFAAPAVFVQDVMLVGGWLQTRFDLSEFLTTWPFQQWVLLGGGIVQHVFEASAKTISGHRQSTMIDNWWIDYGFTLAWVLPWSALLAARMREHVWRSDRVVWLVAVVLLGNAVAGASWPWWGT